VAAPGVEGNQPPSERRRLRWAQATALTASLWYAMPSGAGRFQHREHAARAERHAASHDAVCLKSACSAALDAQALEFR